MKDWGTWKSAETKRRDSGFQREVSFVDWGKTHEFFYERALLKSLTVTVGG